MLIDHAEAHVVGLAGVGHDVLAAVDDEPARIGQVVAHDALDQRALACAVLAEQGVKAPGLE